MNWLNDQNHRNAIVLIVAATLWLIVALQAYVIHEWGHLRLLIVFWFSATSFYFAFRAVARIAGVPPGWLSLNSPLYEITGWVMNVLMLSVIVSLRKGWFRA